MGGVFDGLNLQIGGVEIDMRGGPITPEIIQEASDRIRNEPPPIPCGCEGNPHLVRPRPVGEITNCIKCGYMAVLMEGGGYRKLNAEEQQRVDDAFKRAWSGALKRSL